MKTKNKWRLSNSWSWPIGLVQLVLIFAVFDCAAQEVSPVFLETNYAKPNPLRNTPLNRTEPAGPMPRLVLSDCELLNNFAKVDAAKNSMESDDAQVINKILSSLSNHHSYSIFKILPKQVLWFTRSFGAISIQSLGIAIHESNHIVNTLLTKCNDGFSTYLFDGHVIKTNHKFGDTPKYSIAAETLPSRFKKNLIGSRFHQYIEQNGSHAGSDFSILLDEFIAYTGAASLDIAILRSKEYPWLINSEITRLDLNPGGMADFMIYALSYLKALRISYPEAYIRLQKQQETLSLLQMIWSASEKVLISSYDLTKNEKSVLIISKDAIAAVYSDEFLGELDRLGITHMSMSSWSTSYLNSIN